MTRTVKKAGQGYQLWAVSRLYVELYSTWPSSTPTEIWDKQVLSYDLPLSALNTCIDGQLEIGVDPAQLPDGFVTTSLPGNPVTCTLTPGSRLVRVVAVLPNQDEVVIYTGLLGLPKRSGIKRWTMPLIDPAQMGLPRYVPQPRNYSNPVAPSASPLQAASTARIYGSYSVGPSSYTPHMTYAEYWQEALQGDPDATFGAGPDLVFTAGRQDQGAAYAGYTVDQRALNLEPEGREITDYLTQTRAWAQGDGTYQPAYQDSFSNVARPAFLPPRVADVGGSVTSSVIESNVGLSASGGGSISVSGINIGTAEVRVSIPARSSGVRLQNMSLVCSLSANTVIGRCRMYMIAQGHQASGYFKTLAKEQPELTAPASRTYKFEPTADALSDVDYIVVILGLEGLDTGSAISGEAFAISASGRLEQNSYSVAYEAPPTGLSSPIVTDEAWTFALPGIHAGLRVAGLPGGGSRPATTRIQVARQGGVRSVVRAGPLPFQGSPALGFGSTLNWDRGKA
ncbi:hypothetical protein GCM10022631_01670 [Deinococcus rubellus]|uniref:Minor tail protein n=1 Tax=Deinococcus rubellus TaxID=1889240 RepID=A0ABY5YLU5_9DEIO|nr:hypothetical protein [Deinococcus rubellus]UWX64748.1 hypothetical protein N0D28_03555 [Deinococcus rubellus]